VRQVLLGDESHIFHYEAGGVSALGGCVMHTVCIILRGFNADVLCHGVRVWRHVLPWCCQRFGVQPMQSLAQRGTRCLNLLIVFVLFRYYMHAALGTRPADLNSNLCGLQIPTAPNGELPLSTLDAAVR